MPVFDGKIASALDLSIRSVEVHRAKLFQKLGVESATQLATMVAEARVLDLLEDA